MKSAGLVRLGAALFTGLAIAGCAAASPRLQESGLNSRFAVDRGVSFEVYTERMRAIVEKTRVDINEVNRDAVLQANVPFELRPDGVLFPKPPSGKYEKGILLVHGLSDSPYVMRSVARHLQSRGFLVRAILLPGHGTVPGDLLTVSCEDWIQAVSYGVDSLKADARRVYVGGYSTGGSLAVLQALGDPEIRGVVLFAPALAVQRESTALAGIFRIFADWLGSPRDDADYARYESFAVNAAYQLYLLNEIIREKWQSGKLLEVPVFTAISDEDRTVDSGRVLTMLAKYGVSKKNKTVRFARKPQRDCNDGMQAGMIVENSHLPRSGILDLSHIGLPVSPDDPHYGRKGGYRSCLHYVDDPEKRRSCLHEEGLWLGEATAQNLKMGTLLRLSYNPFYDRMMEHLDRFLGDLDVFP